MATREQIIEKMCLTWRHDFGLDKGYSMLSSGMTEQERNSLRMQMSQLYDHCIAPHMQPIEQK